MPRVPIAFSEYSDTRLGADEQSCVNMYPHSKGGLRQFPGLTSFKDAHIIEGSEFAESTTPCDAMRFGNSDAKFYRLVSNSILEYDLSTDKDLSTASLNDTQAFTFSAGTARGMDFEPDGSSVFLAGVDTVASYSLSTPWDVTTQSAVTTFDASGQISSIRDVFFSYDGERMYLVGYGAIYQYNLSTGFDLSTASYASKSLSLPSSWFTTARNIFFRRDGGGSDGESLWVQNRNQILEFSLSSAWELDSATKTKQTSAGFVSGGTNFYDVSFCFSTDGQSIYLNSRSGSNYTIGEGQLPSSWLVTQPDSGQAATAGRVLESIAINATNSVSYYMLDQSWNLWKMNGITKAISLVTSLNSDPDVSTSCNFAGLDTDGETLVAVAVDIDSNPDVAKAYSIALSNDAATEITDADLDDAFSTAHLDSRFYFDQPDGQVIASALNDATTFDALDTVTAESNKDEVVRVLAVDQLLYFFGKNTIEVWFTSGVGRPPIDRQTVIDEVGLLSRNAVTVVDNTIYFMDDQRRFTRMKNGQFEIIYIPAVASEFRSYSGGSTAILSSFTFDHENFIVVNIGNNSWAYHEPSGNLFRIEDPNDTNNEGPRNYGYLGSSQEAVIAHNGLKILELSDSTYQFSGSDVTRTIDTQLITSELYGARGQELIISGFFPEFEASGAGTVTISIAKNGGSFGNARTVNVTAGTNRYRLHQWGRCREAIFRISTTSNIKLDVLECSADIEAIG